jgi:hypothetical protein
MAEPILVSRWQPRTLDFYGVPVQFLVRALSKRDAPTYFRKIGELFALTLPTGSTQQGLSLAAEKIEKWDNDWVREIFLTHFKLVTPIQFEGEDRTLTTAMDVFEEAEVTFVIAALNALQNQAAVSTEEGNGSGSPSTSQPAAGPDGSDTAATDTAVEDSPAR